MQTKINEFKIGLDRVNSSLDRMLPYQITISNGLAWQLCLLGAVAILLGTTALGYTLLAFTIMHLLAKTAEMRSAQKLAKAFNNYE